MYYLDDDKYNGQPRCEDSCEAIDYEEIRNIYCDNCKDGYVNMKKFCVKCQLQQPHCFKCEYDDEKELDKFKCTECFDGYKLYNEYFLSYNALILYSIKSLLFQKDLYRTILIDTIPNKL